MTVDGHPATILSGTAGRAAEAAAGVVTDGFVRFTAGDLSLDPRGDAFARFRATWEDLRPDDDLADGGAFRYRRYGRLRARPNGHGVGFEPLPHKAFRQEGIPMWRGVERMFAPLALETLADPCLHDLVSFDLTVAMSARPARDWTVGLHAIRVLARSGQEGAPTPEGAHRDGHAFVGMHLLSRENAVGGQSRVHRAGRPDTTFTLDSPLDSVLVDDTAVRHQVSSIAVRDPAAGRAVRDMLLVDLNPV